MSLPKCFHITTKGNRQRLDIFLKGVFPQLSRSLLQRLICQGKVTLNKTMAEKPSYLLKTGDEVSIILPSLKEQILAPQSLSLKNLI